MDQNFNYKGDEITDENKINREEYLKDLQKADFDIEFAVHVCNYCLNPIDYLDDLKTASEHFEELTDEQQSYLISHYVIHIFADTLKYYINYEDIIKCLEIIDVLSNCQTKICLKLVEYGTVSFLDKLLYSDDDEIKDFAIDCLYNLSIDSAECRHAIVLTNVLMSLSNLSRVLISQNNFSHFSRYVLKTAMHLSTDISTSAEAESYLPLINACLGLRDNERFMRYGINIVGHIAKAVRPDAFLKEEFWTSFIDFWSSMKESQSITRAFTQFVLSRSKFEKELKILLDHGLIDIISVLLEFGDEALYYGVIGILQNIVFVYQDGADIVFGMDLWEFFMHMLQEGHIRAKEQTQQFFLMLFMNVNDEQKGIIIENYMDIMKECIVSLESTNLVTLEFCLRCLISMCEHELEELVEEILVENDLVDVLDDLRDSETMIIGELARHLGRILNKNSEDAGEDPSE